MPALQTRLTAQQAAFAQEVYEFSKLPGVRQKMYDAVAGLASAKIIPTDKPRHSMTLSDKLAILAVIVDNWRRPPKAIGPYGLPHARLAFVAHYRMTDADLPLLEMWLDDARETLGHLASEVDEKMRRKSTVRDMSPAERFTRIFAILEDDPNATQAQIAEALGCDKGTVSKWFKDNEQLKRLRDGYSRNPEGRQDMEYKKRCNRASHRTMAQRIKQNGGDEG